MKKAERANAGLLAAAGAAPVLLAPQTAWAASDPALLVAAGLSGVVGACVGAGIAGGVGYVALRRAREHFEMQLQAQAPSAPEASETHSLAAETSSMALEPAPKGKHAAGPQVAPGHGALTAQSQGLSANAAPVGAERRRNPYLELDDLDDVAVAYVAKKGLRERMAIRAKGVTQVLSERLGKNMLDDMPVLVRADGSVGDLGTSWWSSATSERPAPASMVAQPFAAAPRVAMAASVAPAPSFSAPSPAPAPAPATPAAAHVKARRPANRAGLASSLPGFDLTGAKAAPVAPDSAPAAPKPQAPASPRVPSGPSISQIIATRVAPIELEAYPEIDRVWGQRDDHWETSLAALDERVEDNLMGERLDRAYRQLERTKVAKSFGDGIGNVETLDEPDGLERDTAFLNFKAPGNHPEVQDTASYINYLIGDEFRRNPSRQARRHARSYLKLHEGGTQAQAKAAL